VDCLEARDEARIRRGRDVEVDIFWRDVVRAPIDTLELAGEEVAGSGEGADSLQQEDTERRGAAGEAGVRFVPKDVDPFGSDEESGHTGRAEVRARGDEPDDRVGEREEGSEGAEADKGDEALSHIWDLRERRNAGEVM
jgi:hypothetical protein